MTEIAQAGVIDARLGSNVAALELEQAGTVAVQVRGLHKTYVRGKTEVEVLNDLNLTIRKGSFESLMGPSGSGKSTLLNMIAGLDRPTRGTISVCGVDIGSLSEGERARWRADHIGFVFQTYNLIPVLSAVENVALPLKLTSLSSSERKRRAATALSLVGLSGREHHRPDQLSGGQQQRVAIARAIVNDPELIVGDEPTGDLDRKSADEILDLLERLNRELGKTIVMVTHDPAAAARASVNHTLNKGALA